MEKNYLYDLIVRGQKEEVEALAVKLETNWDLDDACDGLATALGVEYDKEEGRLINLYPLDKVLTKDDEEDKGEYELELEYISPVFPLNKLWENIVKKYAPNSELLWLVEENESNFYATNDVEGKHFGFNDYVKRWFDPVHHEDDTKVYFKADELKEVLVDLYGEDTLENLIEKVNQTPPVDGTRTRIYEVKKIEK